MHCINHVINPKPLNETTQSRIIGAVRGALCQLWVTIIPLFSPYSPRKYDKNLAHRQLSDLQGEIRPICRTLELQGERILISQT